MFRAARKQQGPTRRACPTRSSAELAGTRFVRGVSVWTQDGRGPLGGVEDGVHGPGEHVEDGVPVQFADVGEGDHGLGTQQDGQGASHPAAGGGVEDRVERGQQVCDPAVAVAGALVVQVGVQRQPECGAKGAGVVQDRFGDASGDHDGALGRIVDRPGVEELLVGEPVGAGEHGGRGEHEVPGWEVAVGGSSVYSRQGGRLGDGRFATGADQLGGRLDEGLAGSPLLVDATNVLTNRSHEVMLLMSLMRLKSHKEVGMGISPAEMDALIDRHLTAEISGDLDGAVSVYTEDIEHDDVGFPDSPLRGRGAAREFYAGLRKELAIEEMRLLRRFHGDQMCVTEHLVSGWAIGTPLGIPGRGRPVSVRLLHLFEFRDGLISRENTWTDGAALAHQLAD